MVLAALGCTTAYCNAQAGENSAPQLPPVQSDIFPAIGVNYVITPPWIYKSTGYPGPAADDMNTAWHLGTEFVFRTALRNGVILPASYVIPVTNDWFHIVFKTSEGKEQGFIFVNIKSNTAMLNE